MKFKSKEFYKNFLELSKVHPNGDWNFQLQFMQTEIMIVILNELEKFREKKNAR